MKRQVFSMLMVLVLIVSLVPVIALHVTAQSTDIRVTIDGVEVNFPDQRPVIVDNRTLVPVRGVFEVLGFEVEWDNSIRTAILTRHDHKLHIPIDSHTFATNGVLRALDVPAQLINDRTMLPLRFPLESIGYSLDWDGNTRTVIITTSSVQSTWVISNISINDYVFTQEDKDMFFPIGLPTLTFLTNGNIITNNFSVEWFLSEERPGEMDAASVAEVVTIDMQSMVIATERSVTYDVKYFSDTLIILYSNSVLFEFVQD